MRWAIFLVFLVVGTACSTKVRELDTPEGTFSEAEKLMEDKFYEEAREQFFRIKTEFPESSLQAQADLRIADSYYQDDSFLVAAESYEDFVRTYPQHQQVDYALHRAGKSYIKLLPSTPSRDSKAPQKALDVLTRLIVDFPESEYAPEAMSNIERAQDILARKVYAIARFYQKQDHFLAAATRYRELIDLYADHPLVEEAKAREIRVLREAGENDRADELTKSFQEMYPASAYTSMIKP